MVYVISITNQPLMPCREARARRFLEIGKAKVIKREPFIIQLNFECENQTQPVTLGVDAGAKFIGLSTSTKKQELYSSEVELRADITNLISTRRELRTSRRNRNTRYRPPRFNNRIKAKKSGWLAPTILIRNSECVVIRNGDGEFVT